MEKVSYFELFDDVIQYPIRRFVLPRSIAGLEALKDSVSFHSHLKVIGT